jgi:rod shape-determining protein MreC
MKRIFSHPLILSLSVIFILIFLNYQGWLKIPQDAFYKLFSPVQKFFYQASLKTDIFFDYFISVNRLNDENAELRQKNEELLSELVRLKEVEQENEFIREQINLPELESRKLVLANVIGRDSSFLSSHILIDKGGNHGVKKRAAVITAGDILIGQIVEVSDSFSKVQLANDSGSRINALIQESGTFGLVKGNQCLSMVIDMLPQGQSLEKGETVITSGLAGLVPKGLLIGQVQEIFFSDVQISQKAKIKPAADFGRLERVFVIKNL